MVRDGYRGYFETPVHMVVDDSSEGAKFLIQLGGFSQVLLYDERVNVGGIAHGMYLVPSTSLKVHGQGKLLVLLGCVPLILPYCEMKSSHWPSM